MLYLRPQHKQSPCSIYSALFQAYGKLVYLDYLLTLQHNAEW